MRALLIAVAAAVAAATVSLACGQDEEALPPVTATAPAAEPSVTPVGSIPTPAPGTYLYRWVNVILMVPATRDLFVLEEPTPTGSHGIRVTMDTQRGDDYFSTVLIDAESGSIVTSEIKPEDSAVMDAIVATRVVSPLDAATAPWPYNGEPLPAAEREVSSGLSFLSPAGETGWHVYSGIGDPCCEFIAMTNGRSTAGAYVDPKTGSLAVEFEKIVEEDRAPLERWLATVKICGVEIAC